MGSPYNGTRMLWTEEDYNEALSEMAGGLRVMFVKKYKHLLGFMLPFDDRIVNTGWQYDI